MKKTIAIAGKGGAGKTTLASLLIRYIVEEIKSSVLAIDADPNESLSSYLGINDEARTIMDIVDTVRNSPESLGMPKESYLDLHIHQAVAEENGFDFLAMGRPEGPGCYCYANNLLKGVLQKIKGSYDYTVIDNEAGLEHLSRRITPEIDVLFVVCGVDVTSVKTARRVLRITRDLKFKVKRKVLAANRAVKELSFKNDFSEDVEFLGEVEDDARLLQWSAEGKSIFDLPPDTVSLKQAQEIFRKIF